MEIHSGISFGRRLASWSEWSEESLPIAHLLLQLGSLDAPSVSLRVFLSSGIR
jgi:hypothetical protein